MMNLIYIQAVYFFITGIWPILHIKSFMKVTGPKTDTWLVKTAGTLICCIALTLFSALYSGALPLPVIVLSSSASFSLMFIDIYYSLTGRISLIYLVDALAECIFLVVMALNFYLLSY